MTPIADEDLEAAFRRGAADDLEVLAALHDRELDAERLAALAEIQFPAQLNMALTGERAQRIVPVMTAVTSALWAATLDGSESFDQLAAAYADIYLTNALGTHPTESPWIDKDGLIRQQPAIACRDWYGKHNLRVHDANIRSEDHIVHQLEFLVHLLRLEGGDGLAEAERFLREHPLRWFGQFAQRIEQRRGPYFYAGLAELTDLYLTELARVLAALVPETDREGCGPPPASACEDGLGKCCPRA